MLLFESQFSQVQLLPDSRLLSLTDTLKACPRAAQTRWENFIHAREYHALKAHKGSVNAWLNALT